MAKSNVLDEKTKAKAYEQAMSGDWDAVGETINELAGFKKDGVDSTGNVGWSGSGQNWGAAKEYLSDLQREFGYNAQDYYSGNTGSSSASSSSYSSGGGRGSGGSSSGSSLTKYLEDMYAKNLEAELAALKSSYNTNVLDLEAQADLIADQYRAARNQTAANNQQQINAFNEYALARGLNTGTSGQAALAQSMAYQNSLGNLSAQEAASVADNRLQQSKMAAEYASQLQELSSQNAAQRNQALYQELVRQEEAAAAAEAAAKEALLEEERFEYQQQQDALDYQLALAKLRQSGFKDTLDYQLALAKLRQSGFKPRLTYAQVMEAVENGLVTDSIRNDYEYYVGAPYNPVSSVNQLGTVAKNLYNHYLSTGGGLTDARKIDLAMEYDNGRISNDELNYILDALGVK